MAGSLSSLKAAAEAVLSTRQEIVAGKLLTSKTTVREGLDGAPSKSNSSEHTDGHQDGEKHVSVPAGSEDVRTPEKLTRKRATPTPSAPRKSTTAGQEQVPRRMSRKRPAAANIC